MKKRGGSFGFDCSWEDPQDGCDDEQVEWDRDRLNEALYDKEQIIYYVSVWEEEYQEWENVTKEAADNLDT